ncbi:MAG: DNA-directed DNA polymerase II small subunit [Euryarchaeota archaeon]|nr:DNA-directed DNA polymerase II small subunit [Euryarchaeota archaeon]
MRELVEAFAARGLQVHPEALRMLREAGAEDAARLAARIEETFPGLMVVEPRHITECQGPHVSPVQVLHSPAARSEGRADEFVDYFQSRLEKVGSILRKRVSPRTIDALRRTPPGEKSERTSLVGMVSDKGSTPRGEYLVLEDATGSVKVFLNRPGEVMLDEVVAVSGNYKNGFLYADTITRPEIPTNHTPRVGEGAALFISDIHFGSKTFLQDSWDRFADWLQDGDEGGPSPSATAGNMGPASKVRYLFVAGDVVDGVGVYPGQERDLAIPDIRQQYEMAARAFEQLPPRIQVIVAPGNHDAVRHAEPQPTLPREYTSLFPKNVTFVSNPALVEAGGLRVLLYHGVSLLDFFKHLNIDIAHPDRAMVEMVRRRHLAPIYGGAVPIAPEREDHLAIDQIPDIIHTGHVHTLGIANYRGVTLINSGTWQDQTAYQVQLGIQPVPAVATLLDLATLKPSVIPFKKESIPLVQARFRNGNGTKH